MTQEEIIKKIESIKASALRQIARKYFTYENINILIRGKVDSETERKLKQELMAI